MAPLDALLDLLEAASCPAEPLPSTDGWELVLAENVAYLVDDERRRDAMGRLRQLVGIEPEQILAAPDDLLLQVVTGMQPAARVARLRRCAELAVAEAPWTRYPGIGKPGAERIALFTGTRAVLALDSNALRVLVRLGYGDPDGAYATTYRQTRARASTELALRPCPRGSARPPTAAPARADDLPPIHASLPPVPAGRPLPQRGCHPVTGRPGRHVGRAQAPARRGRRDASQWPIAAPRRTSDLAPADLAHTRLDQAYLRDTFLTNAWMPHSSLRQADFRDAHVTSAVIRNADLSGAVGLTTTATPT